MYFLSSSFEIERVMVISKRICGGHGLSLTRFIYSVHIIFLNLSVNLALSIKLEGGWLVFGCYCDLCFFVLNFYNSFIFFNIRTLKGDKFIWMDGSNYNRFFIGALSVGIFKKNVLEWLYFEKRTHLTAKSFSFYVRA